MSKSGEKVRSQKHIRELYHYGSSGGLQFADYRGDNLTEKKAVKTKRRNEQKRSRVNNRTKNK